MSFNTGAIFGIAKSFAWLLLGSYLTAIMTLIASRGKYKGQAVLPMISAFIMFPFFLLIQVPLDIVSLFIKNLKWRKIPHGEKAHK